MPDLTDLTEKVREALACPRCNGQGVVPLGEHFVSRDMAMDAGEPQLEGESMGVEWGQCSLCWGGILPPEPAAVARALNQISHSPMCRGRHGEECRCNRAGDIRAALAALRERR